MRSQDYKVVRPLAVEESKRLLSQVLSTINSPAREQKISTIPQITDYTNTDIFETIQFSYTRNEIDTLLGYGTAATETHQSVTHYRYLDTSATPYNNNVRYFYKGK